jgi:hypothetical protein
MVAITLARAAASFSVRGMVVLFAGSSLGVDLDGVPDGAPSS